MEDAFVAKLKTIQSGNAPFPQKALVPVTIMGNTYTKVIAPGKSAGVAPWITFFGAYYERIQGKHFNFDMHMVD